MQSLMPDSFVDRRGAWALRHTNREMVEVAAAIGQTGLPAGRPRRTRGASSPMLP
jgi:hypothetical protein